jgi:hypothetical protein
MPELKEAYQNTSNYNASSWSTEDLFLADVSSVSFIVYCSVDCNMSINWKIDEASDVLTDSKSVLANTGTIIYTPVKARYANFSVDTFNSLPCDLKTSSFFF